MLNDIKARLASLGYTFVDSDEWVLSFVIDKVENHIKSNCNLSEVPEELYQVEIDLICGEFLFGKLNAGAIDVEAAVSSIKEGDTQVNFTSGTTPSERYAALIDSFRTREIDFARFRKILW